MYRKVLAAINEHLNSEISARYAVRLAKASGAHVYFCAIAEQGLSGKAFHAAEEAIRRLSLLARELDVKADCVIETGGPVERISAIVEREEIDIVFASTRHEDVRKRFYARTTARRLSLRLPCSVALVRVVHLGRVHPKTILVPLKARLDHIAERARFTALMADAFGSRVHLFHATRPLTRFFHGEIHLSPSEWEARLPPDIARFVEELNRRDIVHEKRLIPGIVGRNITIEAAAKRHGLIIMGASGRSLVNSFLRGNPVEHVLRETPCDLIILRPGHED